MHLGYSRAMLPVMMHEALIEERRRLGLDKHDEVWDGVIHMVPSASRIHQRVQLKLAGALTPIVRRRGLDMFLDFDLMDPVKGEKDFRQPDITIVDPAHTTERATQRNAHVAIEILSPYDESRHKIAFYARQQVQEIWLLDVRLGTIEVYAGATPVLARDGVVRADALGLELQIDGEQLVIRDGAEEHRVDLRDIPL